MISTARYFLSFLVWPGGGGQASPTTHHDHPTTIIIFIYGHCRLRMMVVGGHMSCSGGDLKHHFVVGEVVVTKNDLLSEERSL